MVIKSTEVHPQSSKQRPWLPEHRRLYLMFVSGFDLMSDLKVLIEMEFCILLGSLFHSLEHKGKKEW